jgi:hypothetical protein
LELGDLFWEKEWKIVQIQGKMQTTIILPKTLYDKSKRKKLLLVEIFFKNNFIIATLNP